MRKLWCGLFLALVHSCALDLELPEQPQRGALTGKIDTQGRITPGDREVLLIDTRGGRVITRTDDVGTFVYSDLAPGLYAVQLKLPGFAPYTEPNVKVPSGGTADVGTLTPAWVQAAQQQGTVAGTVRGPPGAEVTGTKIELKQGMTVVATTSIPIDGTFALRVPAGTYDVFAAHPWYTMGEQRNVTVAADATSDVMLTMGLNPARLTGELLLEQEDAPAAGQANVRVLLNGVDRGGTDATGRFTVENLAAGTYQVSFTSMRHADSVPSRTVRLEPLMTTDVGTVTLPLIRGSIKGSVKMADNTPIESVSVAITGKRYGATVARDGTDPSIGRFELRDVPLGMYQVVASREKYAPFTAQAVVTGPGAADVGTLTLALLLGDFQIDDADALSVAGFTRVRAVNLVFDRFPTDGTVASFRASEDPTFMAGSLAFQPYTGATQPFTLSPGDARKTVYAQYRTTMSTNSGTFSSSITLDTAAPQLDSVAFAQTGSVGTTKFTRSSAASLGLSISGLDPQSTMNTSSGIALMRVGTTLDGMGNVTAAGTTYQSPTTVTRPMPLADGPLTVHVQLVDNAGNASMVRSDTVVVDTAAPTGTLLVQQGPQAEVAGYTNDPIATLALGTPVEPNGGVVQVKLANASGLDLDSAVPRAVTPMVTWFLEPTDGAKTVYAVFVDSAGNVSSPVSSPITLDTQPPNPAAVSLTTPAVTNQLTAGLSFTTSPADLAPMTGLTASESLFFTGAGTVGPMALPVTSALSFALSAADGQKTVYVRFRDRAGNVALASVSVTVDRVAPTLQLQVRGALADGTPSSAVTSSPTVSLDLTSNENVWYVVGNESLACPVATSASWLLLTSPTLTGHSLATSATSPRQVKACVRDAAGNITGPVTSSILLDDVAPASCNLTLTGTRADGLAPPAGKTANPNVRAGIACSETLSEVFLTQDPAVTCTAAAALPWQPFSAMATTTFLLSGPDGLNTVRGCVRDRARNVGALPAAQVTLDTLPPDSASVVIDTGAEFINGQTVTSRGGNIGQVTGFANGAVEWALSESPSSFTNWATYPGAQPRSFPFAGTGLRTLYASFRDDVGNVSATPFDQIDIDVTAPDPIAAGTSVTLRSQAPNAEYTNNVSVVAELRNAPADTWTVKLGETAAAGACTTTAVSSSLALPLATNYTFLLTATQGLHRLCAQLIDRAGNATATAALVSDTITFDSIPPTALQIVTPPSYVRAAAGASFDVVTAGASTDASPVTYAQLGGQSHPSFNTPPNQISASPPTFRFALNNSGAAAGTVNDLRLKAVDAAGNESGVSSVLITADNAAPAGVTTNTAWVDNTSMGSTVFWQGTAPDVVEHIIRYGSSPSDLTGTYASQGISPVTAPFQSNPDGGTSTGSFTLTNLPNGSPTFVTITPVDRAGNQGTQSAPLPLQPNEVSPNVIATLGLDAGTNATVQVQRMTSMGTVLYAAGPVVASGSCTGSSGLVAVDAQALVSPVQAGQILSSPPQPRVAYTATFADGIAVGCSSGINADLLLDGNHLFLSAGRRVHVFDVADPLSPVEIANIDLSTLPTYGATFEANGMTLIGDRLFVRSDWSSMFMGHNAVAAISLAKLFDANALTQPSVAGGDVVAVVAAPGGGESLVHTRDRLIISPTSGSGATEHFNALEVVDGDATNSITTVGDGQSLSAASRPTVSGNYLYTVGASFGFSVFDVTPAWTAVFGPQFPIVSVTTNYAVGQTEMHGTEAYSIDGTGVLHGIDLSDLSYMRETAVYTGLPVSASFGAHVHTMGNYLAVAGGGTLTFLELGTPRGMRVNSSIVGAGYRPLLHGGFVVQSGTNRVYDVQKPVPEYMNPFAASPPSSASCVTSIAMMDDWELTAEYTRVRAVHHEREMDRDPAVNFNFGTDQEFLSVPVANARVTDVDAVGSWMITTEVRFGGGAAVDGIWIEVWDARKWRDREPATDVVAGDLRGSFRVSALGAANTTVADATLWGSKAVITIDNSLAGLSTLADNVFIVELRPLLDDAAGGVPTVVATFQTPRARLPAVFPPFIAVPTSRGVYVFDAPEAFDADALTAVPNGRPPRFPPFYQTFHFDQVAVHGSYMFLVPASPLTGSLPAGMPVFDISGATAWTQTAFMPLVMKAGSACFIAGDPTFRIPRNGIVVKGSRAWLSVETTLRELSLE